MTKKKLSRNKVKPLRKKNLGIRATDERWQRLNRIARGRNTSLQKLVDEAIDSHLFGKRNDTTTVKPVAMQEIQGGLLRAAETIAELIRIIELYNGVHISDDLRAAGTEYRKPLLAD